jgi:hypothetical protein
MLNCAGYPGLSAGIFGEIDKVYQPLSGQASGPPVNAWASIACDTIRFALQNFSNLAFRP